MHAMLCSVMARRVAYHRLPTEQPLPQSRHLDALSPQALLALISREDARMLRAVRRAHPRIIRAINLIARSLRRRGRLFFVGAGTSGRLGVLEAAECPPTFSTPPSMVQAVMAGGRAAVFRSREGAEDHPRAGRDAVRRRRMRSTDVVVGIAASGVTPFVEGALRAASSRGANTILITGNPRSPITATVRIVLAVGPEVLAGSTRLKVGTATKLVLNMLTLGAMVRLGKTYGHWMVDVRPHSRKLRARAQRLVERLSPCASPAARAALHRSGGSVKTAILMVRGRLTAAQANQRLLEAGGSLRSALSRRI
jgi:N-acetylmuramic acid 6-phosphate etherase